MCGAVDCPSCGPAQGYSPCPFCGEVECECEACSSCSVLIVSDKETRAGMCVECIERESNTVEGNGCSAFSDHPMYYCTRPDEHDGPHIALGGKNAILEVWK